MTPNGNADDAIIRQAQPDDFAAVADLTVAVYVGEGYSPPATLPRLRNVAGRAAVAQVLVAADPKSDQILGTVSLLTSSDAVQIARPGEAEVQLLAVGPAARGRGAGERLMQACIERARTAGCASLVLSTQPSMVAAHRLYERLGFRRVPDRDWQTESGSDRLVYVLSLTR